MKLVFVFLVAFCAVQCFGASIANIEESNKTYEDGQEACVLKALKELKTAVKEGKEQCNKDKKCLIKLAIRVTVKFWKDIQKCRNNMEFVLGEPRISDTEIWELIDDIINQFGDQLPHDIKDLLEKIKKILKGDAGDDKTDCDKQRRHASEKLRDSMMTKTKKCFESADMDMDKCIQRVLVGFAKDQRKIDDQYKNCMEKNEESKAVVFSDEIWELIDDIINKFGDQLPKDIKDLLKKLKKILNGDSGDDKTDCDKQRRHASEKLRDSMMTKTKKCFESADMDMDKCIQRVLVGFAKDQRKIDEQYKNCMEKNEESKSVVFSDEIWELIDDIINQFGDQLPKDIKDLLKKLKKILNGDSGDDKTDCDKQRRHDSEKLSEFLMEHTTECMQDSDMDECLKNVLIKFARKQQDIEKQYQECMGPNIVFILGKPRITDEQLFPLMWQINAIFEDKLPKEVADLMEQYKKILADESEERNTKCFQQKRDDLFALGQEVVVDVAECAWGDEYEKCMADHLATYPKKQEKILEKYEECAKKNF